MKNKFLWIALINVLLLFFAACSDDDNPSDPNSNTPESAGTYSGTNHMDTTMSVTISGIDGVPYVTSYSLDYKVVSGGTISGSFGMTDSDGIDEVVNNSFEVSLGTFDGDYLRGTVNGNQISGSYKFIVTFGADTVEGNYTISK